MTGGLMVAFFIGRNKRRELWNMLQAVFTGIGGWLGCFLGGCDGLLSVERICDYFKDRSRQASCNYAIGAYGRIGLCVDEANRSWCSSSRDNDQRTVTVECASDLTNPYAMKPEVYSALVELCFDICRRNGKRKLVWIADREKALSYEVKPEEMLLTVHRWFARKSCPGNWLFEKMGSLADEVNSKL